MTSCLACEGVDDVSYKNIDTTEEDRATAVLNGINYNTLKSRLAAGWPKDLAINKSPIHRYGNEEYALYKGEKIYRGRNTTRTS